MSSGEPLLSPLCVQQMHLLQHSGCRHTKQPNINRGIEHADRSSRRKQPSRCDIHAPACGFMPCESQFAFGIDGSQIVFLGAVRSSPDHQVTSGEKSRADQLWSSPASDRISHIADQISSSIHQKNFVSVILPRPHGTSRQYRCLSLFYDADGSSRNIELNQLPLLIHSIQQRLSGDFERCETCSNRKQTRAVTGHDCTDLHGLLRFLCDRNHRETTGLCHRDGSCLMRLVGDSRQQYQRCMRDQFSVSNRDDTSLPVGPLPLIQMQCIGRGDPTDRHQSITGCGTGDLPCGCSLSPEIKQGDERQQITTESHEHSPAAVH